LGARADHPGQGREESCAIAGGLGAGKGGMASYALGTVAGALLASLLFGCCLSGVIVSWTTLIQRGTPAELLGRSAAAGEALASIPYVGAIGLGSALVTMVDYRALTVVAAAGSPSPACISCARLSCARVRVPTHRRGSP
jgi:hypothetical protein